MQFYKQSKICFLFYKDLTFGRFCILQGLVMILPVKTKQQRKQKMAVKQKERRKKIHSLQKNQNCKIWSMMETIKMIPTGSNEKEEKKS